MQPLFIHRLAFFFPPALPALTRPPNNSISSLLSINPSLFFDVPLGIKLISLTKPSSVRIVLILSRVLPASGLCFSFSSRSRIGGIITGSGVCVMHYIGMEAMMPENVHMTWDVGVVAASVVIAIIAAITAFWILFRLLSLYPEWESLRIISAIVMTIAVCGMHYTGMAAAIYEYDDDVSTRAYDTGSEVRSDTAVFTALACGVTFSWLMTMLTQSDLRRWHFKLSETISRTDVIFEDMKNAHYSCNEAFVGRYEYIKGAIFDRRQRRSQIVPSFDSTTGHLRSKNFVMPPRFPLDTVKEGGAESKDEGQFEAIFEVEGV